MGLPWWISSFESGDVERVLRALSTSRRVQFEQTDAEIFSRLVRNGYVRAEIESTVIGIDGPVAIELESRGLTDLGEALLRSLGGVSGIDGHAS